jgi:hypothetical protein
MVTGNTAAGVNLNGGTVRGFTSNLIEGNGGGNSVTNIVAPQ